MLLDAHELPDDSPPPPILGKLVIVVTRIPGDMFFSLALPGGNSEYVDATQAHRLLLLHGVREPVKILDHVQNFYRAVLYVKDPTAHNQTTLS